jgi:hypothetical protein
MKQYKRQTLAEFERAVVLCAQTDPAARAQAATIFDQLQRVAEQMRITDRALYAKMKEARRSAVDVHVTKSLVSKAEQNKSFAFQ